jgi:hypothetical protein
MTNVGRNMYAYTSDVEEILKFNIFKGFKKLFACKTGNNLFSSIIALQPILGLD